MVSVIKMVLKQIDEEQIMDLVRRKIVQNQVDMYGGNRKDYVTAEFYTTAEGDHCSCCWVDMENNWR